MSLEILEHQIKAYFYHKRLKENLEEKQMTRDAEIHGHDIRNIEKNMKNESDLIDPALKDQRREAVAKEIEWVHQKVD